MLFDMERQTGIFWTTFTSLFLLLPKFIYNSDVSLSLYSIEPLKTRLAFKTPTEKKEKKKDFFIQTIKITNL